MNTTSKLQPIIDVSQFTGGQSQTKKITPTVIIQSAPDDDYENQKRRVESLEKKVKIQLLADIFIVLAVLLFIFIIFVFRKDFENFIAGKFSSPEIKIDTSKIAVPRVVIANEESLPPVYINQQGVNLEKAFIPGTPSTKLTASRNFKKEIFGYLPYWVVPQLEDLHTEGLTSLSYFGLEVDGKGNIIKLDVNNQAISPWTILQNDQKLKDFLSSARKKKIKVYVTLKCFSQSNIVSLTTSEEAREKFINNSLFLMSSKSLDGLNIDFEYIGTPTTEVRDGFSLLISDLNNRLKKDYPKAVLTVATFVDAGSATRLHDVAYLANNSDGLVIMGYDFHTPNSTFAGPVAPMEGASTSIKGFLSSYLEKAPAEKLILAVPYYGYDWPVSNAGANAQVTGSREEAKALPYGEIIASTQKSKINWQEDTLTPWYAYRENNVLRIVHFDNVRSLGIKYDYINEKNLQGVGIWALGFDGKTGELTQLLIDKFSQ